jgi:hypothetical protein
MKAGDGNGAAQIVLTRTIKLLRLQVRPNHDGHRQPTPPHIAGARRRTFDAVTIREE